MNGGRKQLSGVDCKGRIYNYSEYDLTQAPEELNVEKTIYLKTYYSENITCYTDWEFKISKKKRKTPYTLRCIVALKGTRSTDGHYTAIVRKNGKYYYVDDLLEKSIELNLNTPMFMYDADEESEVQLQFMNNDYYIHFNNMFYFSPYYCLYEKDSTIEPEVLFC